MTAVLVDTSVWVDHFKRTNADLVSLLAQDRALVHPMVLGELACGTPPDRTRTLSELGHLLPTQQASLSDTLGFVERERLFGLGCGLVDMVLLASALLTPDVALWSMDKRLASLAQRFEVSYSPK